MKPKNPKAAVAAFGFLEGTDFLAHEDGVGQAKQTAVIATNETMCGITTRRLCASGRGPEKRVMEMASSGPTGRVLRVDLRRGSMTVAVASE
jgi:hypothetical protein